MVQKDTLTHHTGDSVITSMHAAKSDLSRLVERALKGDTVIIARNKTPVARIVPIHPPSQRTFGALKGKIGMDERFFDPLPNDELEAWGET